MKNSGACTGAEILIDEHRQQRLPIHTQETGLIARKRKWNGGCPGGGDAFQHHRPLTFKARYIDTKNKSRGGIEQTADR